MDVEEAYSKVAQLGLHVFNGEDWDRIIIRSNVGNRMVSSEFTRSLDGNEVAGTRPAPFDVEIESTKAALFLRDDLLKTTGDRIWTMTMTIESNGKFDIKYGYEKPEDWE